MYSKEEHFTRIIILILDISIFFAADVIFYHLQSVSAYFVVSGISPVSMSVANTLKRSILIALPIAYFGNQITSTSVLGLLL